jgi:hypothetical protein
MKKICAITMARNDEFFLNRWIDYYGSQLGEENLYIFLDGKDQPIPKNAGKANVQHEVHVGEQVVAAEKKRLAFLSEVAANLLQKYDLVVDPQCGKSLVEYLSGITVKTSVSGLGLDVGQKLGFENKFNEKMSFLSQREYAFISSRYTKPSVISKDVHWGSGFHRIKGHNFKIDPNLYLFHFGSIDFEMIQQRFQDKDRMATGREKHIKKRARTIDLITKKKALSDKRWLYISRLLQTCVRPLYALNKPSMAGLKLVIKIPEQFKNII